jgi:DNA polymerase-1
MDSKDLLKLLDGIKEEDTTPTPEESGERILIIDGLNLFLRNFAVLNYINTEGTHIGGLGGFLRSLGSLVKQLKPTSIYIVFDGVGSSINRKNLLPEYKSGRNVLRVNKSSFDSQETENESKTNQIIHLIHYLQCLPVKILSLDGVEADDIIAFLSKEITKDKNNKAYIVSADNDFLQLVDENVIMYRSVEKEFVTPKIVKEKYGVHPHNFLLYKTLMGDSSDKVGGVKGLGAGKFQKLFPEVLKDEKLSLDHIYDICAAKFKEHVIYCRALENFDNLRKAYKIMDLSNPMLDEQEKEYILEQVEESPYELDMETFLKFYHKDGLGHVLKNVDYWIRDNWIIVDRYNKVNKNK